MTVAAAAAGQRAHSSLLLPVRVLAACADVQGVLDQIEGNPCAIDCNSTGYCTFDIKVSEWMRVCVCAVTLSRSTQASVTAAPLNGVIVLLAR